MTIDERQQAIKIADRLLDEPHADPDGDICVLARQFNRQSEELAHTVRLLHVVRAWSSTPGDEINPAREDILYPLNNGKNELWKEINKLLDRHPYRSLKSGSAEELPQ
jgi:hypothetical protein